MSPIREILGVGERRPAGGIIFPRGAMPDTVLATTDIPQTSSAGVNASVSGSITPTESSFSSSLLARTSAANMARYKVAKSFMQFPEYLSAVEQNPIRYLRQVSRYFLDAVEYWDKVCGVDPNEKIKVMGKLVHPYAFTSKPWEPDELVDKEVVRDQLIFWNDLIDQIRVLSRKKHPNKMVVIHGPNATGKSLVFDTVFGMLENYSKTDEGALYTYEWAFGYMPGEMGFHTHAPGYKLTSEPIDRSDLLISIPAGKNASPIFLLNKLSRVELLKELQRRDNVPDELNTDYLIAGSVNDLSRRIYEALLDYYEGDDQSVLNHVHVVRWTYSAQGRRGLVLIQPQVTPNTRLVEVTPEINWDDLPKQIVNAFRNAGIHTIEGDEAEANHGLLVYDDFLKDAEHGSIDEFLHLLRFAEKAKTTISTTTTKGRGAHAIDEEFDCLLFGTTNDDTLTRLQSDYAEWPSLDARLIKTPMWMARCYKPVTEIFRPQLVQLIPPQASRHISPDVLEAFGLWLTMTYLFPVKNLNYYNSLPHINADIKPRLIGLLEKKMGNSMLEKALLYQGEDLNSHAVNVDDKRYTEQEQGILRAHVGDIADEYNLGVGKHKFFFYEGSIGFSTRDAEPVLQRAIMAKPHECFSIIELFDILDAEIKHGFDFEEKRKATMTKVATAIAQLRKEHESAEDLARLAIIPEPPSTRELLNQVREHEKRKIKYDVYEALGCIKSRDERLHDLRKYVEHVTASMAKRPVKPQWEDPEHSSQASEQFMHNMEVIFYPPDGLKEGARKLQRGSIASGVGDWASNVNNRGRDLLENLDEIDVMKDLIGQMVEYDVKANKQKVTFFLQDLRTYYERGKDMTTHNLAKIEPERLVALDKALEGLRQKGYCEKCITKHVYFAFE